MNRNIQYLRRLSLLVKNVPGGGRVCEALRGRYARRNLALVLDDFDGASKFEVNLSDHIGSQIYWYGHYSSDILRLANKLLMPSHSVFDIGANVGEFSVYAARRVPQGQVHAFEPLGRLADAVNRNLDLNGFQNAHVHQVGFSDESEVVPLFVSVVRGDDGAVNNGLNSIFPCVGLEVCEEIKLTPMDEWCEQHKLEQLDFIKMDVEGAEMSALCGGVETIRRFKPLMIVEVNPKTCIRAGYEPRQLVDCITGMGYSILNIGPSGNTSVPEDLNRVSRDVLCVPK